MLYTTTISRSDLAKFIIDDSFLNSHGVTAGKAMTPWKTLSDFVKLGVSDKSPVLTDK